MALFENCCGIKLPGVSLAISSALAMAPFMPFAPSVRITFAPYALIRFLLSTDIVSGMVIIMSYPFAAAAEASPIPVLPLVGSIITDPFFNNPLFSASSIIALAILSFTLPAGLKSSNFANRTAGTFSFFSIRERRSNGVLPTSSDADLYIFILITHLF